MDGFLRTLEMVIAAIIFLAFFSFLLGKIKPVGYEDVPLKLRLLSLSSLSTPYLLMASEIQPLYISIESSACFERMVLLFPDKNVENFTISMNFPKIERSTIQVFMDGEKLKRRVVDNWKKFEVNLVNLGKRRNSVIVEINLSTDCKDQTFIAFDESGEIPISKAGDSIRIYLDRFDEKKRIWIYCSNSSKFVNEHPILIPNYDEFNYSIEEVPSYRFDISIEGKLKANVPKILKIKYCMNQKGWEKDSEVKSEVNLKPILIERERVEEMGGYGEKEMVRILRFFKGELIKFYIKG